MNKMLLGLAVSVFAILLTTFLVVMAQSSDNAIKPALIEKYEKAIKVKDPGFRQMHKSKDRRGDQEYTVMDWAKGGDWVDIECLELHSVEEASTELKNAMSVPVSVPIPRTKLTNLGDEAYISIAFKEHTQMFIRKGNVFLRLNASSPKLAKRFARHLIDSIDN